MPTLAENLSRLRHRIADAALQSGRAADAVSLVAVTKYVDEPQTRELALAGCLDLGESRPQQLQRKAAWIADVPIRWHLVGHLQRNKATLIVSHLHLWHSADSIRILATVNAAAGAIGRTIPTLLEVNISGDAAKHGFSPDELEPLGERLPDWSHLRICGLMAMSGLESDSSAVRCEFGAVRQLRDRLQAAWGNAARLSELSMGMSDDFEAGIAEGATLVRIGSALFEGVT